MKEEDRKTLEALKKAKEAVDMANEALESAIQELDVDSLSSVAGGSEFSNVPGVKEHPYDPHDKPDYITAK